MKFSPYDRARNYIAKCPPAISGQHDGTFRVAVALVRPLSRMSRRNVQIPLKEAEGIHV